MSKRDFVTAAFLVTVVVSATSVSFCGSSVKPPGRASNIIVGDVRYSVVDRLTGSLSELKLPCLGTDLRIFPDRQRFIFSNRQWDEKGGIALARFTEGQIGVTLLTHGNHLAPCPSWSQRKVAFILQHQVAVLDLLSGKINLLKRTGESFHNLSPIYPICWSKCAWIRKDRGLLCAWQDPHNRDRAPSLWYVGLSSPSTQHMLLEKAGCPAVSPKDGRIAFIRYPANNWIGRVWLGLFSTKQRLIDLRPLPFEVSSNVAWSPDGQELAYIDYDSDRQQGDLRVYDVASGTVTRIAGPSERIRGSVAW